MVGHTIQEQGINSACAERVFRIDVGMSKGCGNGEPEVHKPNLCNVAGQMGHTHDQRIFCPHTISCCDVFLSVSCSVFVHTTVSGGLPVDIGLATSSRTCSWLTVLLSMLAKLCTCSPSPFILTSVNFVWHQNPDLESCLVVSTGFRDCG